MRNHIHFFTILLLFIICAHTVYAKKELSSKFHRDTLRNLLIDRDNFTPVPKYGDAYWQEQVPVAMRQDYISCGASLLESPWISLPAIRFSDFRTTGDRNAYQNIIFPKRNQLIALAIAEVMEAQGRFMPDIINGILSLCEETWWGVPAHYRHKTPLPEQQSFDLFNAKIAAMGSFLSKSNIGNGYCVNFADSGHKINPYINCIFPTGVYLNDKNLCSYASEIAESYDLKSYVAPTEIMLITPYKPELKKGEVALLKNGVSHTIVFNPQQIEASFEKIDMADEKMDATWGELYRVMLQIKTTSLKGQVKYRIK